ncbi:ATP-binding protein [Planomonospora corallina]|uniref:histidine kinase n=1 Tax=Planomonospora corallina TaxID=1806052 RepID=A0ABV8I6H2_9ACTN
MAEVPMPSDEAERLRELYDLRALEAAEGVEDGEVVLEPDFQAMAELAAYVCRAPIALVSLVGRDRQYFKGRTGVVWTGTDRQISFCAHTICGRSLLEVHDARTDPRFRDNILVTGEPHVRFYAGAPMVSSRGYALGTVCVLDTRPRRLNEQQRQALHTLAREAAVLLETHRSARLAEEALRHLREMEDLKRNFLTGINHELRTPLTSIRSYLQLILDGGLDRETEHGFLKVIERNGDRLLDVLDELLLLASLNARTAVFEPGPADLVAITRLAVEEACAKASHREHTVTVEAPGDIEVRADSRRLRHALVHLLDNAFKFSPPGGRVDVVVTAGPPAVEIRDNGIGVTEEDIERVFESFYRAPEADEHAAGGSGVGLTIVKKIVQLHGGIVRMERNPGGGICVRVVLPEPPPRA